MSAAPTVTDQQPEEDVPFYKTVKRVGPSRIVTKSSSSLCSPMILSLQSFRDVNIEGGVQTDQFCEACDAVIQFFGMHVIFSLHGIGH